MDQEARALLPEFWSAPPVAAALGTCDVPCLLEEIRKARGWNQRQLAAAVGYSQPWVSKVLRRQQPLTVDQVRDIARRLHIPLHLLRFGDPGGEDPTNRREFGTSMALALMPLPKRVHIDETTAATLTRITGAQRRLDATTPARELSRSVCAHVEMAGRVLTRQQGSPFTADVAAAVSEAAGFAAWLHADMHDVGTARRYYRLAIDRAQRARHGLLAGYMLGSLAAFEIECDEPEAGLALMAGARQHIADAHPTASAWTHCIEAIGYATRRDIGGANRALNNAAAAVEHSDCSAPPPWPWVFPFDHPKLAGYQALVAVRLNRPHEALRAFADSLPATQPAPKQRAVITLEVATAVRQAGESDHDTARTDEAFRLAHEALDIGMSRASERVLHRARRFRRGYRGPSTERVRRFDHRLHESLL